MKAKQSHSITDDTVILCTDNEWTEVEAKTNMKISKISLWFGGNQPSLNIAKTTYLIFVNYSDSLMNDLLIKIDDKLY